MANIETSGEARLANGADAITGFPIFRIAFPHSTWETGGIRGVAKPTVVNRLLKKMHNIPCSQPQTKGFPLCP
jgi:hypothetical protein